MAIGWFAYQGSQVPNVYVNDELYLLANQSWNVSNASNPIGFISEKLGDEQDLWRKISVVANRAHLAQYLEVSRVFDYIIEPTTTAAIDMIGGITTYRLAQTSGDYYAIRYGKQQNASWVNNTTPFTEKYERCGSGVAAGGFSLSFPIASITMFNGNNELIMDALLPLRWIIIEWRKNSGTPETYNVNVILYSPPNTVAWYLGEGGSPTISGKLHYNGTSPDPYGPGGHTHPGGGGSFDGSSDPIGIPVPSGDPVLNSGFVTMYKMNINSLKLLSQFLWDTNLFDPSTWQKIVANPFDAIISLDYIPANPNVLTSQMIKIGNVTTDVASNPVAQQFVQIDCGTLTVEEYFGSYLDYSPFTKIEIYLPYIGFRELNTDEVMNNTLTLVYNLDIVSGACVANIKAGNTVLYQYAGNCAMQIPIVGRDPAKNLASILGVVTSAGSIAGGAITGTLDPQGAVKAVTATAESVMGAKRNINRSGNISGSAGYMGGQTPYLIITRPNQALPEDQNKYTGYPAFITSTLSELSGMTYVSEIHLEDVPCTEDESREIERLLKEGVVL